MNEVFENNSVNIVSSWVKNNCFITTKESRQILATVGYISDYEQKEGYVVLGITNIMIYEKRYGEDLQDWHNL